MNFIEKILESFFSLGEHLTGLFSGFIDFLTMPLALFLSLLEGVFYFINNVFQIVVLLIKIVSIKAVIL